MKHIVQFSGGAASSYVAWMVAQKHPHNTVLLFHDTKAEHPDAYRFREQVSDYIGIPITEYSDGRSLWEVIDDNKALPSYFMRFCTRILKQEPAEEFLQDMQEDYILYNGFGPDEGRRVQRATARAESLGRTVSSPLFDEQIHDGQVKNIIRNDWGICLPEPYQHLLHNNCIPCFLGGKEHFRRVAKHYPEQFDRAIMKEDDIGYTVFKDCTLRELREEADRGQSDRFLY